MTGRLSRLWGWVGVISLTVLLSAGPAAAGGIINKGNQSADYMRTLNRNAATDYADIAVYNPAGTAQMEDGLYSKLDVMYFGKDYYNDVPGFGKLEQDEPSLIPAFFTVYKKNKWSGFFAFTVPAGGGELNWEDGNARTVALASGVAANANAQLAAGGVPDMFFYDQIDPGQLEVKQSSVLGFTLGAAYAINDMWSVSLGTRYSTGTREFDGSAAISATNPLPGGLNAPLTPSLNIEQDASGWAGIVGVNFAPNDKLNTSFTFISNTKMEYDVTVNRDTLGIAPAIGFADGSKRRTDIPGQLGFGASYRFLPELKVDLNYTLYLEDAAEIDTYEDEGDSWDLGLSGEYTFNPSWKASLGYLLTNIRVADDQQINEPEEPKLSANALAAGVVWSATSTLDVTLAGAYIWYDSVTDSNGIEYGKAVTNISAGIQYKFF